MDEAEESEARPLQELANGEGFYLHREEAGELWLTPIPDPLPPDYRPRRNDKSIGPFSSFDAVARYLKDRVPPE